MLRLAVEKTTTHVGWDSCAIASDGRLVLQKWNYQKADQFQLDGKAISLPFFDERRLCACGEQFVYLGHPWVDRTEAMLVTFGGSAQVHRISRKNHEHHLMAAWVDGDHVAMIASDTFHVVHGIGIIEGKLASRVKQKPVAKVLQLNRHIGKGHAQLSLQSVMRVGKQLYAIASAGYRYRALLALEPKAKTFGSRVIAHHKADNAVFSSGGAHAVFYERGKPARVVGLDGSELATITIKPPAGTSYDLVAAAPAMLGMRKGKGGVVVMHTPPWPGSAPRELANVPRGAAIADLNLATAAKCSPEPVSYRGKPPAAFGAVIGWTLNANPDKAKPAITHAIITDVIINFFTVTKGKLRLLFNFDLSAIDDVAVDGDRVTITTPSGKTVLRTTRNFAKALVAATK